MSEKRQFKFQVYDSNMNPLEGEYVYIWLYDTYGMYSMLEIRE